MTLPQNVTGVNPKMYHSYNFEDHIWGMPGNAQRPDLLELAQRCCRIGENYFLKQPSGAWMPIKREADARRAAENLWLNGTLSSGAQIDAALIKTFFTGEIESITPVSPTKSIITKTRCGACPMLHGQMVVPHGPPFLTYSGKHYVNVFRGEAIAPDETHRDLALGVLLLVYRSLCNGPQLHESNDVEASMLLQQVMSNTMPMLEFRFLMNWLAALVQRPGLNLQTNVWICGERQGVGKGTVSDIMRAVLGNNLVGHLDQQEIESGYSNHLFGKALIISNEFDSGGRWSATQWNKWVKATTCEPTLAVRERYLGQWLTLNIGNYMFTTNDTNPIWLDQTDRRNMMVGTTSDPYWQAYASHLKSGIMEDSLDELAAGWAWILGQVKLDLPLVMSAPLTQLKADAQSARMNRVEEWLQTETELSRDREMPAHTLYTAYREWAKNYCPGQPTLTLTRWGIEMTKLAKCGVTKGRNGEGVHYHIPPVLLDDPGSAPDRAAALEGLTKTTRRRVTVVDNDAVIAPREPNVGRPSPLERLRAALRAKDARDAELHGKIVELWPDSNNA